MRLERINDMEQYIIENESVSLERLASHFNISVNTVRRDIRELIERGQIKKVYGGVSSIRVCSLIWQKKKTSRSSRIL